MFSPGGTTMVALEVKDESQNDPLATLDHFMPVEQETKMKFIPVV